MKEINDYKEQIIELLCSEDDCNMELAEMLCKGLNLNIDTFIRENYYYILYNTKKED